MPNDDWPLGCKTGNGGAPEPKRNVAVVAVRNERGEILMVKTRRFPEHWQPVGGGVENSDATPEAAARRELHEETEVLVDQDAFRLIMEVPYDFGDGTIFCYEVSLRSRDVHPRFNASEVADHRWVTVDETHELSMFPATRKFLEKLQDRSR